MIDRPNVYGIAFGQGVPVDRLDARITIKKLWVPFCSMAPARHLFRAGGLASGDDAVSALVLEAGVEVLTGVDQPGDSGGGGLEAVGSRLADRRIFLSPDSLLASHVPRIGG